MPLRALTFVLAGAALAAAAAAPVRGSVQQDGIALLLHRLETALQHGDGAVDAVFSPQFDATALAEFRAGWHSPAITRAVVRERDRTLGGERSARLVLEVLLEYGQTARMLTWQATALKAGEEWLITSVQTLASVEGLHRLQLDTSRQFRATNLRVVAEDFQLTMARGDVFLCRVSAGITGLVMLGRGEMIFEPRPETEQRQLELFDGRPFLRTPFRAAFVRLHPADYGTRLSSDILREGDVVPATLATAQQVFRTESAKSFAVDLGELSRDAWSLLPPHGDFLAEVRTNRFGTLTYVHTGDEPENISLFDRARQRNISIYSSRGRVASRGPFYNEDDETTFDVLDYNVDVTVAPDRFWFDGRSSLRLRTRRHNVSTVSLRLNSSFAVRAVRSIEHGRLLFLRVRNQNALVVNLPTMIERGAELTLSVTYSGRLEPHPPESEAAAAQTALIIGEPEPALVYSNRSYWYPQSSVTDYASAAIRMTLPLEYGAICSGVPAQGSPVTVREPAERHIFVFTTHHPVRYLGCVISRFSHREAATLQLSTAPETLRDPGERPELALEVHATPRLRGRARELMSLLQDVTSFYAELMGEVPYPRMSLAMIESLVPGGHSPPYLVAYNQPLPGATETWTNDPTSFSSYPEFFLAHEVAHQWWGHGVGWQNYHEQWLSEGFSQYFAALYAERRRGPAVFASIIRQMSQSAVRASPQGPVYLGYRLGHLKGDPRVFRSLVYNKGAMVLHMLRRIAGDEAFVRSLRRFYRAHRFDKAGTEDLRRAFEAETGLELGEFFRQWIYGWTLPSLTHTSRVERTPDGPELVVLLSQRGAVFDFPVTVTVRTKDGRTQDVVVRMRERTVERRIPLAAALRDVQVNTDRAAMLAR